jgi:hypothetical protein
LSIATNIRSTPPSLMASPVFIDAPLASSIFFPFLTYDPSERRSAMTTLQGSFHEISYGMFKYVALIGIVVEQKCCASLVGLCYTSRRILSERRLACTSFLAIHLWIGDTSIPWTPKLRLRNIF